jgi:hypothetical protein
MGGPWLGEPTNESQTFPTSSLPQLSLGENGVEGTACYPALDGKWAGLAILAALSVRSA